MDNPLLTLYWPPYGSLAVNSAGKWIAVETEQGIVAYDGNGRLVGQMKDDLHINPKSCFRIFGDELAYVDKNSHMLIYRLPDFTLIEEHVLSSEPDHNLMFNQSWIISAEIGRPSTILHRKERAPGIDLDNITSLDFIDENSVLVRRGIKNAPIVFDLKRREVVRELFSQITAVSPNFRYMLERSLRPRRKGARVQVLVRDYADQTVVTTLAVKGICTFCHNEDYIMSMDLQQSLFKVFAIKDGEEVANFELNGNLDDDLAKLTSGTIKHFPVKGLARSYDLSSGKRLETPPNSLYGSFIKLAASGRYISLLGEHLASVFDLRKAEMIWQKPAATKRTIGSGVSIVEKTAIYGSWVTLQSDSGVEVWDFLEDRLLATCPGRAHYSCFSPPYLFFTGSDSIGSVRSRLVKFDVERQAIVGNIQMLDRDTLVLTDTYGLLSTESGGRFSVVDPETMTLRRNLEHVFIYSELFASRNAVVLEAKQSLKLLSLADGHLMVSIPTEEKTSPLYFSENGRFLITHCENGTRIDIRQPFESVNPVYSLKVRSSIDDALIADDNTLVTSHRDGTVNFWDITHITQGLL